MERTDVFNLAAKKIPYFRGVYMVDEIPIPSQKPAAYIINTLTSYSKERYGHWIAIVVTNLYVCVLDSLGLNTKRNKCLSKYLKKIGLPIVTNHINLQPLNSKYCGIYCLVFLFEYINLKKTFSNFVRDIRRSKYPDNYICYKFNSYYKVKCEKVVKY